MSSAQPLEGSGTSRRIVETAALPELKRISSGALQLRCGEIQNEAALAPIVITTRGKDRSVIMSFAEYRRLSEGYFRHAIL